MQNWQKSAWALLLGGMLTSPLAAGGFEPASIHSIARFFGVGWGEGYHARPCHPPLRAYYDCVTQGGTPIGAVDARCADDGVRHAGSMPSPAAGTGRVFGEAGLESPIPPMNYGPPPAEVTGRGSSVEEGFDLWSPGASFDGPRAPFDTQGNSEPLEPEPETALPEDAPQTNPSPIARPTESAVHYFPRLSSLPPSSGQARRPLSPQALWSQQPTTISPHQSTSAYRGELHRPAASVQPPRNARSPMSLQWP